MPTHKADLTVLNVSQLAALVRCKPQTMRRKLDGLAPVQEDGRTRLYDSAEALSRYFLAEALDLTRERARLAKEQADGQQLRNEQARAELVPGDQIEAAMIALTTV